MNAPTLVRAIGPALTLGILAAGPLQAGDPPASEPFTDLSRLNFRSATKLDGARAIELFAPESWAAPQARIGYKMSTAGAIATGAVTLGLGSLLLFGSNDAIGSAGDATVFLLPAAGGLTSALKQDWQGLWMFTKSLAVSTATVHVIKETAEKWRPNGSNQQSFPSGHTQGAFTGASFLDTRYGHDYGIPAYLAAAFTGASRVITDNHFADDVISGASITLLTKFYFVKPLNENTSISPMFTEDGYGISLKVSPGPGTSARDAAMKPTDTFKRRFRFSWEFGSTWANENTFQAPANQGDVIDYTAFGTDANPTTSARANFDWYVSDRGRITFSVSPYEARESSVATQDFTYAGQDFVAGESVGVRYLLFTGLARYSYDRTPKSKWDILVGGGVGFQYTNAEVTRGSGPPDGSASNTAFMPTGYAHTGYRFNEHWEVYLETDLLPFGDSAWIDTTAALRYHINPHWEVGLEYRYVDRSLNTAQLVNDLALNQVLIAFGYTF